MIPLTEENYIQCIGNFQTNTWPFVPEDKKEQIMQFIVDYMANQMGLPSICKVKIKEFHDGAKKGEFDHKSKELGIERELAVNCLKPPYRKGEISFSNLLAHKEVFEILMHEFCHAIQEYAKEHPEQFCNFKYYHLLHLNHEHCQNIKLNAYFLPVDKNIQSMLLYAIQPVERDACIFADRVSREFNDKMHDLFPDDLAFHEHDSFSAFQESMDNAKRRFKTTTPFEDINDIIRHINGVDTLNPLNEIMYQAVIDTQTKSFKQQLAEFFSTIVKNQNGDNQQYDIQNELNADNNHALNNIFESEECEQDYDFGRDNN